ncbi:MAG TPA: hypothetical protein VMF50_16495 [Candidatus Binataceae bacterium]|nr:hypothetical protein [Candidatus Binataceae bacterium]
MKSLAFGTGAGERAGKRGVGLYHLIPFGLCLALSQVLALLPCLLWMRVLGKWIYIADRDNLYYLQLAARVYYGHAWFVSDPAVLGGWSPFPWMQFVPAAALARICGISPFAINTIWLVTAGLGAAAGSYFLFYQFLRRRWAAALCTIVMISSVNLREAQPLIRQAIDLIRIASGHPGELTAYGASLFEQYRVVHPGLSFPLVLFQIGFLARARTSESKYRALLPGLFFALCIYSSLYDWTAIAFALALAFILDRNQRRCYAEVAMIGVLLGSPGIFHSISMKPRAVGLPRISLLLKIPRDSYLMIPKAGIALAILSGIWILLRQRRDLAYLWALAVAALLLSDSARITGIELHNGHWSFVWGPLLNGLFLLILATEIRPFWRHEWAIVCAVAVTVYAAAGIYMRAAEALETREGVVIRAGLRAYQAQRMGPGIPRLAPGSVIGGDELFADLAAVAEDQRPLAGYAALQAATMTNDEWETRWALNRYLLGISRDQLVSQAQAFARAYQWGPWAFGEIPRSQLACGLIQHFDAIVHDPRMVIQAFRAGYIAIPGGQDVPDSWRKAIPAVQDRDWKLIQRGPQWLIYANAAGRQ